MQSVGTGTSANSLKRQLNEVRPEQSADVSDSREGTNPSIHASPTNNLLQAPTSTERFLTQRGALDFRHEPVASSVVDTPVDSPVDMQGVGVGGTTGSAGARQSLGAGSAAESSAIGLGDRGANVEALQKNLTEKGYSTGPVDGIFGRQTLAALDAFQADEIKTLNDTQRRLPPHARNAIGNEIRLLQQERQEETAGAATLARLQLSSPVDITTAVTSPVANDAANSADLSVGDSGPAVSQLQRALIELGYTGVGKVDGKFGPNTMAALAVFQQDQISGMEARLEQALPPDTRRTFELELSQLRAESSTQVAGARTQAQLENPVDVPELKQTVRETIESFIPDFSRRSDQQKAQITEDLNQLVGGTGDEKLSATLSLVGNLDQQQLRGITLNLGVNDTRVARVLGNSALFSSAAVLTNTSATDTEKLIAYGELAQGLGALTTGRTSDVLKPYLQGVKGATSVVEAWDTWNDPNATAEDKAQSVITAVAELSKTAAVLPHDKAKIFGKFGNMAKVATAATTLLNPDATAGEKALAVSQVIDAVVGLKSDVESIAKLLSGHVDPNQLNQLFDHLPAKHKLPAVISDALDPRVLDQLTHADADGLVRLGKSLHEASGDSSVDALSKTLSKLDLTGVRDFSRFANQLEGRALDLFVRSTENADARVLDAALSVLKRADPSVVRNISRVLDFTAGALDKAGVKVTKEVGEKLLKAFGKAIPVVGAAVAVYDAVEMGSKAADTSLPDELRYLALSGTKANVVDALYSVLEPVIAGGTGGLGVAPDIALAGTTLAIDLVIAHEESRMEEMGDQYQAPDWIGHVNVATAIGSGDLGGFYSIYGFADGNAQIKKSLEAGGELAVSSAEGLARMAGEGLEQAQQALTELLIEGGPAATFLNNAVSQLPLGPELGIVLNNLEAAGEAGKDALQGLADSGVDLASDILNGIWNTINPFGR